MHNAILNNINDPKALAILVKLFFALILFKNKQGNQDSIGNQKNVIVDQKHQTWKTDTPNKEHKYNQDNRYKVTKVNGLL